MAKSVTPAIHSKPLLLVALALLALLSACSSVDTKGGNTGFYHCKTPRPEMCTREYKPVCGHIDTKIRCVTAPCPTGKHQTYGNSCSACAQPAVVGYEEGSCESYGK